MVTAPNCDRHHIFIDVTIPTLCSERPRVAEEDA
jgi:hypothetical protein